MSQIAINNVKIVGMSACVPKTVVDNETSEIFSTSEESAKFIASTGIKRRHIVKHDQTSADLCYEATEKLIKELDWHKDEIDCLIFVTQTPDYVLPATSCILQRRLGLSNNCFTLDISLGCSGWVYGLSVISSLLSHGSIRKGLLLAGDTVSKIVSQKDKSTYPLFGDAGTATALQFEKNAPKILFDLMSDGEGFETIIVKDGGYRNPYTESSEKTHKYETGVERKDKDLYLNGMDVFSFGISKAPQTINNLLNSFQIEKDSIDFFIFHQANLFMNEKIRKKLNLSPEKVPYSMQEYGNASCATIPLTMVNNLGPQLREKALQLIGCGFGVGLSWGSVYFETDKIACPTIIEI